MDRSSQTVHVVDDDASFRAAVGELLGACGYQVSLYETAKELLKTSLNGGPACILLDVQMSGLSGPQLQDELSTLGCRLPIIFITAHGDIPTTVKTIKAGADDFLTKPVTMEKLVESVERALARHKTVQDHESKIAALRLLYTTLTPREKEVFALLVKGKPHKQIAFELDISDRTVKLHRHQVVQKLKVRSLAEMTVIADRLGLVSENRAK